MKSMNNERWKDIIGYEGYYQVSSHGRVKSLSRKVNGGNNIRNTKEIILKQKPNKYGYSRIILGFEGNLKAKNVHRLVAEAFIDNTLNKPCVNHIDGDKFNNKLENLEWCTYKENVIHAISTGLTDGKNNAILSKEQVVKIRELLKKGWRQKDIAASFNISKTTVGNINTGKTYKDYV